jgi:hypothetical protein
MYTSTHKEELRYKIRHSDTGEIKSTETFALYRLEEHHTGLPGVVPHLCGSSYCSKRLWSMEGVQVQFLVRRITESG